MTLGEIFSQASMESGSSQLFILASALGKWRQVGFEEGLVGYACLPGVTSDLGGSLLGQKGGVYMWYCPRVCIDKSEWPLAEFLTSLPI